MKVKSRVILEDCIERGIKLGWNRAHKHLENPNENVIFDHLHQSIMEDIYEYFSFDDEEQI